jgi:hypothetical protein
MYSHQGKEGKKMHEASLHEEIVKLASDLFERSGRVGGRDLDNWLEAERIVVTRRRQRQNLEAETPVKKMTSTAKASIPRKVEQKQTRQSSRNK